MTLPPMVAMFTGPPSYELLQNTVQAFRVAAIADSCAETVF